MHKFYITKNNVFDSRSLLKIEKNIQITLSLPKIANLESQFIAGFTHISEMSVKYFFLGLVIYSQNFWMSLIFSQNGNEAF